MGGAKRSANGRATRLMLAVAVTLTLAVSLAVRMDLLVPSWASFSSKSWTVDIDGDGMAESLELGERRLSVSGFRMEAYVTPSSWQVMDAIVCDVDGNGEQELAMLVWRRGNYGSSRPFWDTEPDPRMTEHLYLLCLRDGQMQPFWMGHDLGREVTSLSFYPKTRLLELSERDGTSSTWVWEGFGFVAADE